MASSPIVIAVPDERVALEAEWRPGARGVAVIAPPHPSYGGRLDNPVVLAIDRGLEAAGVGALRFNFRGTGESTGTPSDSPNDADADYRAALARLSELGSGLLIAAGYSFGAVTALRVAAEAGTVQRLILVAPPLATLDARALQAFRGPVTILLGDDDTFAPLSRMQHALTDHPRVHLDVIEGADHFFGGAEIEIGALVAQAAR